MLLGGEKKPPVTTFKKNKKNNSFTGIGHIHFFLQAAERARSELLEVYFCIVVCSNPRYCGHGCEEFFSLHSTAAFLIACGTRERLSCRVTLSACVVAV